MFTRRLAPLVLLSSELNRGMGELKPTLLHFKFTFDSDPSSYLVLLSLMLESALPLIPREIIRSSETTE